MHVSVLVCEGHLLVCVYMRVFLVLLLLRCEHAILRGGFECASYKFHSFLHSSTTMFNLQMNVLAKVVGGGSKLEHPEKIPTYQF